MGTESCHKISNDLIEGKKTVRNKEIRKLAITKHNKIYIKRLKMKLSF
jgi:hypothetical protein